MRFGIIGKFQPKIGELADDLGVLDFLLPFSTVLPDVNLVNSTSSIWHYKLCIDRNGGTGVSPLPLTGLMGYCRFLP